MHGNSELLANSTNRSTIVTTAVVRAHIATEEVEAVRAVAAVRAGQTRPIVAVRTRTVEV